ncbi:MAG TPA: vWA domain-containing protein [Kofleriaceae bacterium]|nr:vWA domain-containing protein [Kofleriaceae bacterium]
MINPPCPVTSSARVRVCCRLGLAGALLGACGADPIVVGALQEVASLPATPNRDLDLLFVIDNSPSMADNQIALARSFPHMIDRLDQLDGGRPNLHIGVVTSDMGTQGSASAIPGPAIGTIGLGGCSGLGQDGVLQHGQDPALTDPYLSDVAIATGRAQNYTGTLADEFARLAQVGNGGCGFEQHLAAMRRALVNPANAGFLRPEANLAVVIVGDEDDCSARDPALMAETSDVLGPLASFRCFAQGVVCDGDAPGTPGDKHNCKPRDASAYVEPVQPFVDALLAAKPDPRQIMVAAVVGNPAPVQVELASDPPGTPPSPTLAPSCTYPAASGPATADPAVRIAALLDGFAGRSQLTSICSPELSGPLDAIGATAKQLMGDPCIDTRNLADTSPAPGIQPACEVTQDNQPGDPSGLGREAAAVTQLAPCEAGGADACYALVADPVACPDTADHLRVRVTHAGDDAADRWTHVRCQLAP